MYGKRLDRISLIAALVLPVAVAAALVPVRDHTLNANIALVMVVVVVLIAVPGNRVAAAIGGIGAGVWFDFFQVRPYYSFNISQHNDAETTILLLIVALAVGELTAYGRRITSRFDQASFDLSRIHAVAEMVAGGVPLDEVVRSVEKVLRVLLTLRDCWFETTPLERPGPYIEGDGDISWGNIRWESSKVGLPSKEVSLMVRSQGLLFGRFVLIPTVGSPVSLDRLTVAVALADQVGSAMAAAAASTF
jgi:hypothetical protein